MEERKPPPPRNPSRTLAKVAVAVLVVIAIAGIVLASLRGRGSPAETPVAAEATQPAASAMTAPALATPAEESAEADAGPNNVVFAPGSDAVSEAAKTKLLRIAETASKGKRALNITAKVEAGADNAKRMDLARNRANAVRGILESAEVPLSRMQIQIAVDALGAVTAKDANRIEVTAR